MKKKQYTNCVAYAIKKLPPIKKDSKTTFLKMISSKETDVCLWSNNLRNNTFSNCYPRKFEI